MKQGTALAGILAMSLLAACAMENRRIIPMTLLGTSEQWAGAIAGCSATLGGANFQATTSAAEVLAVGRTALLLNSHFDERYYISMVVDPGPCVADGRTLPYRVSACLALKETPSVCSRKLDGCAESATRQQAHKFAEKHGLLVQHWSERMPQGHPRSCADHSPKDEY